jgi:hypothetical protein
MIKKLYLIFFGAVFFLVPVVSSAQGVCDPHTQYEWVATQQGCQQPAAGGLSDFTKYPANKVSDQLCQLTVKILKVINTFHETRNIPVFEKTASDVLLPELDLNSIAPSILPNDLWAQATPVEKKAFTDELVHYAVNLFSENFGAESLVRQVVFGSPTGNEVPSCIFFQQGAAPPERLNVIYQVNAENKITDLISKGVRLTVLLKGNEALKSSTSMSQATKVVKGFSDCIGKADCGDK